MPKYKRIKVKEALFGSIVENAVEKEQTYDGENYPIYITNPKDDLLLRYIEFKEYYAERPDKIKHLDYILEKVNDENERITFIDKLHFYTALPEFEYEELARKSGFFSELKERLKRVYGFMNRIRKQSPRILMTKLIKKIKN